VLGVTIDDLGVEISPRSSRLAKQTASTASAHLEADEGGAR